VIHQLKYYVEEDPEGVVGEGPEGVIGEDPEGVVEEIEAVVEAEEGDVD